MSDRRPAVYARVSTAEQSTEPQIERLSALCQSSGWGEPVVYRDDGISGVRDNRPALDRLRSDMLAGKVSRVVVTKIDRLGRSAGMVLRFWDEADSMKVPIHVTEQGIETASPTGRFLRTILAAVAELEREFILERTQAGVARARAQGKKFGRPRKLSSDKEAEIVSRRENGESLRWIAQAAGVKLGTVRAVLNRAKSGGPVSGDPGRGAG